MNILIRNVLHQGSTKDIFITDGRIAEISSRCARQADRIIDGTNKAALPALINGHTHAAMTLFRGYADDLPLKHWLEGKIWPLEAKLTEEDIYWGSKLACLEMIKNGITVFNDMYWYWEATAKAVCDMGIRGFISAVFIDMFDARRGREQIEENLRLFALSEKYTPHVTFTFGPHAIYTVSKESLQWMAGFAEQKDLLIHMHLSETASETDFSREKYGLSPTEFLDSLGVLSERFIGCHGCTLDENDCAILERRHANLVHVPVSNLKLAVEGSFPYLLVQNGRSGIPFCFGTDGCASNNHLDLIESMKFASLLAKFVTRDPTVMAARNVFMAATEGAAAIFRLGDWTIEAGRQTDIMLVDLNRPEMTPNFDIYSNIVYASNGYVVDTVISMGRVLMENRYVPGEEEILKMASLTARNLAER